MTSFTRCLLPLLLLAACSGRTHILAGNWSQELPDGKKGITLTFDDNGERLVVHGAPAADGTHGHPKATFTWDEATKTLTVKGNIVDETKEGTWSGKLDGDHLELSAADGKLRFRRGGEPQGH